jgi:hypothetical protein
MSENKFSSEDVRGVLLAAGYKIDQIVKFMSEVKDWFTLWQQFERRAYENMNRGLVVNGLTIIKEIKANHNFQPYFCAMFNGKYRRPYFKTREKNNKSAHYQREAA